MSQDQLIRTVANAAPVGDREVESLDLGSAERELLERILATPTANGGTERDSRRHRFRRTRALRIGAALAGAAAAAALILGGVGSDDEAGDGLAFAAEWIEIAERNPRLLLTEPGWEVTRADEYDGSGEMTFSNGEDQLDVYWRRAEHYDPYFRDRAHDNPHEEITLLGRTATMFRYAGTTDFTTIVPPEGPTFVEIRGDLGGESAYLELIRSLEPTDVETWLSAMPPSVVRPVDREAAVAGMVEDIPLPPGFDAAELARAGETVSDRYQLGAAVTGTVACTWFDLWTDARTSGDVAAAQEAERAMASSPGWAILVEMKPQGGWSQVVWEYTRKMEAGTLERSEYSMGLGCGRYR